MTTAPTSSAPTEEFDFLPDSEAGSPPIPEVAASTPSTASMSSTKKKRNPLYRVVILLLVIAGGLWLANFIHRALIFEQTDDAYIDGHVHQVSSRVAGSITQVLVKENETVKSGQVLARLDPLEFDIALQEAKAALAEDEADVQQAQAALAQTQAQQASMEAQVTQTAAQLDLAKVNYGRDQRLFQNDSRAISKADVDSTQSAAQASGAALAGAKADVVAAQARVQAGQAAIAAAKTKVDAARAALLDAERQRSYVEIKAPSDGRIGNKNVEIGNRVQVGQALFAVVDNDCWITANFKETQLQEMHPGQSVEITVDAIGSHSFMGTLDSISPASGAQFALLPPDNATGNFTKVVQRVPIKITFDPASIRGFEDRLRPGLSTVVSVRVK